MGGFFIGKHRASGNEMIRHFYLYKIFTTFFDGGVDAPKNFELIMDKGNIDTLSALRLISIESLAVR